MEAAVKSHMKYLRDTRHVRPPAVQHRVRIRSRQQRIYERRTRTVKAKEAKNWKFITPDMMSEEEEEGGSFIRHKPSWRSNTLNRFLEKLERRFKEKHPNSLAKPRTYGEPIQKAPPAGIPSWMVKPEQPGESVNETIENELSSDEDDANSSVD
ncbi:hypothetical protein GBAR_LOCUS17848 [Geodia barretti]|uniref:Uncharacterized protein n=1 Tax=Geodia barretti TaxID=519541 RepID=A0AA35SJW1_GEOBA|nr:hypothetical protein GBAR_LOCUS17848 [Geodia barretti]